MMANKDKTKSYAYVIEQAGDGSFWAYLPDLPGCTTSAVTPQQVEQRLPEAVDLYLSYYRERGLAAPAPQARVGTLPAA